MVAAEPKIFTPALKRDRIYRKGLTIFAALSSAVLLPQTGFSHKFIFVQSAKSALLTEKLKVRDCVIQKTVAEFGLVFVEFGKMEGKASQGRNPRGCKHINQKSRSKRQRGKWPKLGVGGGGERLWEIRLSWY